MRTLTFPSPTGDLYFSINTTILNVLVCQSFRPLPGTYISQWRSKLKLQKVLKKFPSPTGDLYFSIQKSNEGQQVPFASFRPLPGTYISQLIKVKAKKNGFRCFRPLPGTYISQFFLQIRLEKHYTVSVPYRGLIFLNYHLRNSL